MGSGRVIWDDALDAALREMRAQGLSYEACSDKLGICHPVVGRRCQELGLNQRMNFSNIPGAEMIAMRLPMDAAKKVKRLTGPQRRALIGARPLDSGSGCNTLQEALKRKGFLDREGNRTPLFKRVRKYLEEATHG